MPKQTKLLPFDESNNFILEEKERLNFTFEEIGEIIGLTGPYKKQNANIYLSRQLSYKTLSKILPKFGWEIKGILIEKQAEIPL